jgi:hypothetical protein
MTVLKTDQAAELTVSAASGEPGEPSGPLSEWAPTSVRLSGKPSRARLDDLLLGGKDHQAVDRAMAVELKKAAPAVRRAVRARREFVERAVHYLARTHQVRDVLVLGTGLPTSAPLHGVVQAFQAGVRAVYVDDDPMVLTHLRARLTCPPPGRIAVVQGHLGQPEELLAAPPVKSLLEPGRPVALVVESSLEFLPDTDDPQGCLAAVVESLPPGSWVVLAHATADFAPKACERVVAIYAKHGIPIYPRAVQEVAPFLHGLRLVAPGLTPVNRWPTPADRLSAAEVSRYGAVARKLDVR